MGVVLLTGGLGFVGRQVLRKLGNRGFQVRLVVRKGNQEKLIPPQLNGSIVDERSAYYRISRRFDA